MLIARIIVEGDTIMTSEQSALAAAVVFAGLWSGLLGMLTLVMHKMLAAMNGGEFERFLRAFLPVGRKAWFNYVCAVGMGIAPIVALVFLWDDRGSAPLRPGRSGSNARSASRATGARHA